MEQQQSILELATALALVRERAEVNPSLLSELCALLDKVEQRILAHKDAFGVQNAKFQLGCEEFVLLSNTVAMQALQQRSPSQSSSSWATRDCKLCGELLQKAEQHTRRTGYLRSVQPHEGEEDEVEGHVSRRLEFRLVCLNNLACYFKEIAKPLAALGFLEKALKIQKKQVASWRSQTNGSEDEEGPSHSIALTHLNLCAVLSQLQRHSAAAEHARSSIALLSANENGESRQSDEDDARKTAQLALIAHFNLGVELEHLSDLEQALRVYQTALQIVKVHGITRNESELVRTIEGIVRAQLAHGDRLKAAKYCSALSPRGQMSHHSLSPRSLRQATTTAHALSYGAARSRGANRGQSLGPPPDPDELSSQVVEVPGVLQAQDEEEDVSNVDDAQVMSVNPEPLRVVDAEDEVKLVAFKSRMMANLVQAFAFEILAHALENVAAQCATHTTSAAVDPDTGETQETEPTTEEGGSTPDAAAAQPKRTVSRRQLIHQVAKATNDHVLAAVLQSAIAVAARQPTESERKWLGPFSIIVSEFAWRSEESTSAEKNTELLKSLLVQIERSTEQIPPLSLQQEELNQQPPPVSASTDSDSARSHVAHAFVHALLLEAAASRPSLKPQISIKPPPAAEQLESPSSGANSRRESPNVHKRNLVKKDSVTPTLAPTTPPVRSQVQQSPSPPVPTPPSADEVEISNDDFASVASADDLEIPTGAQSQVHAKTKSKRDAARPKHHHSHKTKENSAAGASGAISDGGAGEDNTETSISTPTATPSTAKLSKLPLDDVMFFSASTSPLSSARLAQDIYKSRPKNGVEALSTTPSPLEKPSAHSRSHPCRHPHHIQNTEIVKETSYSRDSPRADAIAAEMMTQKKAVAKSPPSASDSLTSHVLLPLTSKAPTIPSTAVQSPVEGTTSTTSKASREKKSNAKSSSPTKTRSGYCQQCVFEGRSCKINDCLKHQLLK